MNIAIKLFFTLRLSLVFKLEIQKNCKKLKMSLTLIYLHIIILETDGHEMIVTVVMKAIRLIRRHVAVHENSVALVIFYTFNYPTPDHVVYPTNLILKYVT